jgi:hypothetical protein
MLLIFSSKDSTFAASCCRASLSSSISLPSDLDSACLDFLDDIFYPLNMWFNIVIQANK